MTSFSPLVHKIRHETEIPLFITGIWAIFEEPWRRLLADGKSLFPWAHLVTKMSSPLHTRRLLANQPRRHRAITRLEREPLPRLGTNYGNCKMPQEDSPVMVFQTWPVEIITAHLDQRSIKTRIVYCQQVCTHLPPRPASFWLDRSYWLPWWRRCGRSLWTGCRGGCRWRNGMTSRRWLNTPRRTHPRRCASSSPREKTER